MSLFLPRHTQPLVSYEHRAMAERREIEKLFQPRSTRWRPGAGWILASALPTAGLFLLLQWTVREVKVEPDNWLVAAAGVAVTFAALLGLGTTLILLALAWLRRG